MKIGISLRRLAEARTGSPKIDMFAVRRVARFSRAVIRPARACSIRLVIDLYPLFERLSFTVKPTQSLHTSDFLQEWGSKTSNRWFLKGFLREILWLLEVLVTRKIPDATCSRVCRKRVAPLNKSWISTTLATKIQRNTSELRSAKAALHVNQGLC